MQIVEGDNFDQVLLLDIVYVNFAIGIGDCKQVFVKIPPFVIFVLDLLDAMDVIIVSFTLIDDVPSNVKLADSNHVLV